MLNRSTIEVVYTEVMFVGMSLNPRQIIERLAKGKHPTKKKIVI